MLGSQVVPHTTDLPRPGWAEHDADEVWWANAAEEIEVLGR